MLRAVVLATLVLVIPRTSPGQPLSVLHIKVVLTDAGQKAMPVPRHGLLISDNPATAAPRLIITAIDGTADVRLRPGNYTIESDRPVAFQGKAYQWTQTVDIVAGRDDVLTLTTENAEVVPVAPATAATIGSTALEADPSFLLPRWQDSVAAVWTADGHASAVVVDAKGLIATNQRVIGAATSVEVQFTPTVKVTARVLASDAFRDVAVLRVDPAVVASLRLLPLGCAQGARPPVASGQEIFTIGAPMNEPKGMASGRVSLVAPQAIASDLMLAPGSSGGPVFTAVGDVIGITSLLDGDGDRRGDARVVRVDAVCEVLASAAKSMNETPAPSGTLLPVEPARPFPVEALKDAAQRAHGVTPYQMSSSDFDVAFITPLLTYAVQNRPEPASGSERRSGVRGQDAGQQTSMRPLLDFGNWTDYVAGYPPVLLVRATPKLVEGFWTTVARGAAMTQGVALPPIKHFKSGFSRLRAFCGGAEVTPIHAFRLEQRVSESDAIREGLYVFDPGALGPRCGSVRLVLYSEKDPQKGDTRDVDPKVLQQVWQDFAAYRDAAQ